MNSTGLFWGLGLCVFGQVIYHSVIRGLDPSASAFLTALLAYLFSAIVVTIVALIIGDLSRVSVSGALSWRVLALGAAIALIEVGYIFSYRGGLPVAGGSVIVLGVAACALLPIGWIFFHEAFSARVLVGLGITVAGLWLMTSGTSQV